MAMPRRGMCFDGEITDLDRLFMRKHIFDGTGSINVVGRIDAAITRIGYANGGVVALGDDARRVGASVNVEREVIGKVCHAASMISVGVGEEEVTDLVDVDAILLADGQDLIDLHARASIEHDVSVTRVDQVDVAVVGVADIKAHLTAADKVEVWFDLHKWFGPLMVGRLWIFAWCVVRVLIHAPRTTIHLADTLCFLSLIMSLPSYPSILYSKFSPKLLWSIAYVGS